MDEHFKDKYVKDISDSGYRSRASYKLLEMQKKDSFMRPGMTIVDLGAAPGGWSQIALSVVGAKGKILATDILPMEPITGVDFIQGDFSNEEVFDDLVLRIGDSPVDLVISDMAPNISGVKERDRAEYIWYKCDRPAALYLLGGIGFGVREIYTQARSVFSCEGISG